MTAVPPTPPDDADAGALRNALIQLEVEDAMLLAELRSELDGSAQPRDAVERKYAPAA